MLSTHRSQASVFMSKKCKFSFLKISLGLVVLFHHWDQILRSSTMTWYITAHSSIVQRSSRKKDSPSPYMFPFFYPLMHFLLCTKKELKPWVVPPQFCSSLTIPAFLPALVEVKSAPQLAFGSALFTSNCGSSISGRPCIFHIHFYLAIPTSFPYFHHKTNNF